LSTGSNGFSFEGTGSDQGLHYEHH